MYPGVGIFGGAGYLNISNNPQNDCKAICSAFGGVTEYKKTGELTTVPVSEKVNSNVKKAWVEEKSGFFTFFGMGTKKKVLITAVGDEYNIWKINLEEYYCDCCDWLQTYTFWKKVGKDGPYGPIYIETSRTEVAIGANVPSGSIGIPNTPIGIEVNK